MKPLRKLKSYSRRQKLLLRVTGRAGAKGGRSEMHSLKQGENGSHSSTQTATYTPECSADLWPLRMTLISLLGAKGYVKLITGERSLPFYPEFTYAFFSALQSIRKQALNFSEEAQSHGGLQTDFYTMLKSCQKLRRTDPGSSKFRSNAKSKDKCRGGHCGKRY
jgi:hypothetical protein